jgi:hypothetical protein
MTAVWFDSAQSAGGISYCTAAAAGQLDSPQYTADIALLLTSHHTLSEHL